MEALLEKYTKNYMEQLASKDHYVFGNFFGYIGRKKPGEIFTLKRILGSQNEDQTLLLLRDYLLDRPPLLKKYYEIKKEVRGNLKSELLDCISDLCKGDIQEKKQKWEKLPYIQEIIIGSPRILIVSEFGNFSFIPAQAVLEEELRFIQDYDRIRSAGMGTSVYNSVESLGLYNNRYKPYEKGNLDYKCHFATESLVKIYEKLIAVTCECQIRYAGCKWLHSYAYDPERNMVIDLANRFVMPKEEYENLIEPTVLLEVSRQELLERTMEVIDEYHCYKVPSLAELALLEREKNKIKK